MENFKIITESTTEIITESVLEESGKKNWFISGVTLQSNIKNKNKRIYPKDILSEAIDRHVSEFLNDSRAVGELNHPTENISSINLDRISHKFIEVKEDGNNFITKAQILDTPCGKIAQNLLEGNVKLGISSRGLGKINSKSGDNIVENLYLVSLGDIVDNPSAPSAFVNGVLESVEFQLTESGQFSRIEVFNEIDKYRIELEKASKEDINKAVKSIFTEFLKKLN